MVLYGASHDAKKKLMWNQLNSFLSNNDSSWVLCGDFNEVRDSTDRLNCVFHQNRAARFNEFIAKNNLIEIPIIGRKFTLISDDGAKFAKLDRFLVSDNFINLWKDLSVIPLDRKVSDHCPLVLRDKVIDYGPKPFKVFNEWFNKEGSREIVKGALEKPVNGFRKDCIFRDRLKHVKYALKVWSKSTFGNLDSEIVSLKAKVDEWEKKAELGGLNELERKSWMDDRKCWLEKEGVKTNMLKQKARSRWILEGDENSKFFHSSIKRKYNKNNIRGLNINGVWNENPLDVKEAIFMHFQKQFASISHGRPHMCDWIGDGSDLNFRPAESGPAGSGPVTHRTIEPTDSTRYHSVPPQVVGTTDFGDHLAVSKSLDCSEAESLELPFSESEIWDAIKDCGSTKAPGPVGFNLSFYKRFWDVIKIDLISAIQFFWGKGGILQRL
ncbi:uncharacterized protein [Rutidosis leptorrhynchoides]|uniref:uncharacterized protein n=1 Tax=Rutidosis leptorrhynchoides TaxID=125765 RepID=UPI003A99C2FA